jgi:alpha-methylacyl-CoA racemase
MPDTSFLPAGTDPVLGGVSVVTTAVNLPGPVAAARLHALGAQVTKIEPLGGDPLQAVSPSAYEELTVGQEVVPLDLRTPSGAHRLHEILTTADVLLTSSRPASLERLGLGWEGLTAQHPRLAQVAIVGAIAEGAERAGHDLTYQATSGSLRPPHLPTVLLADLAGAERAVSAALAALLRRTATGRGSLTLVGLFEACTDMARPLRWGLTTPTGPLGGALPAYRLYAAADGWVALAALEPHFLARTLDSLGVSGTVAEFEAVFRERTTREWEKWADEHDIPLAAVR